MNPQSTARLVRGSILHFLRDPGSGEDSGAWQYFEDGALFIEGGLVRRCADWAQVIGELPELTRTSARYVDYRGQLIVPGFVDCHAHYPQMQVMGSFGRQLLDWLNNYTFPAESSYAEPEMARKAAEFFVDRLIAHGVTTASVFPTVHAHSVDAFFEAAQRQQMRMLCGKVMMDRNCPSTLCDTAESAQRDCAALIARWHGKGRLRYSVTPRFAPTSTPAQLEVAGALYRSRPDLHLQTHLSENLGEISWVASLFPECQDYLDVYDRFGLLGPRTVYGHSIHLSARERARLAQTQAAIAFCPSSNQFLGSGAFDLEATRAAGVSVGLASDVGGGTSLSPLRSMASAYQIGMSLGQPLPPLQAWYLATLGGAQALGLEAFVGNFAEGREADFVVLDWQATPELAWRQQYANSLEERLFALMMLGDERCIRATHVLGERTQPRG